MDDEREELKLAMKEVGRFIGLAILVFLAIALGLGILFSVGKYVYGIWS
ncbi:MAG: hypothetical protein RL885_23525 [Planctomycetota bacterium]